MTDTWTGAQDKAPDIRIGGGNQITEGGLYNFVIIEAWDSLFAPPGSRDYESLHGSKKLRHIGFVAKVLDDGPQHDHTAIFQLYTHITEKEYDMLPHTAGVLNSMGARAGDSSLTRETPLGIIEFVDLRFHAMIEMRDREGKPSYPNTSQFNMERVEKEFDNLETEREIRKATEEEIEISKKHYEEWESRGQRRTESSEPPGDDDIPF